MIYGAAGYTGRQASQHAKELGLNVMLSDPDDAEVKKLGLELELPCCSFNIEVDDADIIAFSGLTAVLNYERPGRYAVRPLMQECIKYGVHYLDVSAELGCYRIAESLDREAQAANVMLLLGCCGSVSTLGHLTQHVLDHNSQSKQTSVDGALHIPGEMSSGSTMTTSAITEQFQGWSAELAVRTADKQLHNFKDESVRHEVLHSINGYTAPQAAILAAKRVLSGTYKAGLQIPAEVFGPDFLTCVEGCTRLKGYN